MNKLNKRKQLNSVNEIVLDEENNLALGRGFDELSQVIIQRKPRPPTYLYIKYIYL